MPCLLALFGLVAPRVAFVLLWLFTPLTKQAFNTWIFPLLGLIFLPYTTLFYVLAWSPVGGVSGWGWFFVTSGVVFDIGHWASSGYTGRQRYATA